MVRAALCILPVSTIMQEVYSEPKSRPPKFRQNSKLRSEPMSFFALPVAQYC